MTTNTRKLFFIPVAILIIAILVSGCGNSDKTTETSKNDDKIIGTWQSYGSLSDGEILSYKEIGFESEQLKYMTERSYEFEANNKFKIIDGEKTFAKGTYEKKDDFYIITIPLTSGSDSQCKIAIEGEYLLMNQIFPEDIIKSEGIEDKNHDGIDDEEESLVCKRVQ